MHKRTLTIRFQRSITAGVPNTMEVAVAPLNQPSAPAPNATLVGGTQVQTIVLSNEVNTVTFQLVPTDHPQLASRVTYRVAWRERYMGRQYTKDIVMPDFNVDFDDLGGLGNIIGGNTYLQWTDRGQANGVAGLNAQGQVINAAGQPVGLAAAQDSELRGLISAEIIARQQGDQTTRSFVLQHTDDQIADLLAATTASLNAAVSQLSGSLGTESGHRQQAVNSLNAALIQLQTSTNAALTQMTTKADLVGGKIPVAQLPSVMFGKAVSVPNESAMLSLTTDQVNRGDFAIRPEGIFFLNGSNPAVLGSWVQFRDNTAVLNINGRTGSVTLTAADVGARPASAPIPQSDVTGLTEALNAKSSVTSVADVTTRVSTLEGDARVVRTVSGVIPKALMPTDAAFVTASNLVAKKDGTVLNLGTGGTLTVSDVGGLSAALGGKANTVHAHTLTDITGLSGTLSGQDDRVHDLENRVVVLESFDGGGGVVVGTSAKTSWWSAPATTTNLDTVSLRSPFGFDGTQYYYNPAGASSGEAVFPYLTPNGHLKFIARNESAPPDPVPATQTDLTTLTTAVNSKASQTALDALTTAVNGKAAQTALTALTATVDTKASVSSVTALTTTVAGKAAQTDLTALTTTVAGKAAQTDLTALTTTVTGKASQAALDALTTAVNAKASTASVTSLTTTVGTKAAQTSVDSLTTRVTAVETGKAALDSNGKIYPSQLPNLALTSVTVVASKAAMLLIPGTSIQPGDVCMINDTTTDRGSYVLTGSDPSVIDNWTKLITPDAGVVTVNSVSPVSGNITLTYSDVGARQSGVNILQSEVTGLTAALAAKLDTSTYTTGLAGKISLADAQTLLTASTPLKWRAKLVDTVSTSVPSGTGITVDGATVSGGDIVLVTGAGVSNGLYVAGTGTWVRATDMATGSYFLRGSAVTVLSGSTNTGTIWQQSAAAGIVGTNTNSWDKVLTAGSGSGNAFTASSGVQKVTVTSGGVTTYDFRLDTAVAARKWSGYVTPQSGNFGVVTHNLGTQNVIAWFRDASTGVSVLVGWKPNNDNTLSVEFDAPVGANQYICTVIG